MSHYAVKAFFEAHPKSKEVFETYDGVLHATREVADKWISMHAHKTVTVHTNPLLLALNSSLKDVLVGAVTPSIQVKTRKAGARPVKEIIKSVEATGATPDPAAPGATDQVVQDEPTPNPEAELGKEPETKTTNQ